MKKTSKILLFLMALFIFSHAFIQPSVAVDSTDDFTREDAVALFEKARECFDLLQYAWPYYSDNWKTEYFDYSVCKNGKTFDSVIYFMVNKNHKYGTIDKTMAWAESIFTHDIADKYVKNIYVPTSDRGKKNYLYDNEGNLWKSIYGALFYPPKKFNVLGFRADSAHAVLTVESREHKLAPTNNMVTNTVNFVKTDDGWRIAESGYFNYYLFLAPPDGSPETGDATAARAAVFTVVAVLAAAVPALILTVKHRRKEK